MNKRPALLAILLTVILSGCANLLQSEAPARQVLWLQPPDPTAQVLPPIQLEVSAMPGLNNDRVMQLTDAGVLAPIQGLYWPETIPAVVSSNLETALARSDQNPDTEPLRIDFVIETFFLVENTATSSWRGKLRCAAADEFAFSGQSEVQLNERSNTELVNAFESVLGEMASNLTDATKAPEATACQTGAGE